MRILVNASSVRIGGGKTVAQNLIHAFFNLNTPHKLVVVAPKGFGYENFAKQNIRIITISNVFLLWIFRPVLDYFWISFVAKKLHANVILSMGNIAIPTKQKQILLFDNPYAVSSNFDSFTLNCFERLKHFLRNAVFKKRLKFVNVMVVQTSFMENAFKKNYIFSKKVCVIPNSFNELQLSPSEFLLKPTNKKKLLCFSRYYPHKNIEICIEIAKIFKERNLPFCIYITIEKNQGNGAEKILRAISTYHLQEYLVNIGEVPINYGNSLYEQCDALLLPTIMESFTSTYVDAMRYKRSIFTSHRDFAIEICGDAAFYFNPYNANEIVETVTSAFENPLEINKKINIGSEISSKIPSWDDVAIMYLKEMESLVE